MLAAFTNHFSKKPGFSTVEESVAKELSKEGLDPLIIFFGTEKTRFEGLLQQSKLEHQAIMQFVEKGVPIDPALKIDGLESKLSKAKANREEFETEFTSKIERQSRMIEVNEILRSTTARIKSEFLVHGKVRMKQAEHVLYTQFLDLIKQSKKIKPMIEKMLSGAVIIDAVSSALESSAAEEAEQTEDAEETAGAEIKKLKDEIREKEKITEKEPKGKKESQWGKNSFTHRF